MTKHLNNDAKASIDMSLSPHDQAVRLMASWISAIADQVKNPVAGISAAATLIEKEMSSFRSAKNWDPAIVEEAVRLMLERLRTFDNYLAELSGFTRPAEIHATWFDVRSEWGAIEQFINRRINQNFKLRTKFADSAMLYADIERFKAVLTAVVLNSVEACGAMINPEMVLTMERSVAPGSPRGVTIKLTDNGPGFSKDAVIQGLVPFFTTKEAGTGLGLAMVEKYLRAHGGWVRIDNSPAGGAEVSLFFPSPEKDPSRPSQSDLR